MAKKSLSLRWLVGLLALSGLVGCSHVRLSANDLDRVVKPAFISRIEEGAGPKANVFREDGVVREKLKRLDPKEADRRLQVKLLMTSRFEVSERLRSVTIGNLPRERPWTNYVSGAQVAKALESFLVEEVPANAPDYELLRPLGADAVVEFVVQDYGMRSDEGKSGTYVKGYGRMFLLDGGEIWRKSFDEDQVRDHTANLDPFVVGREPQLFRRELAKLLDKVAKDFAAELTPPARKSSVGLPEKGSSELSAPPDSTNKTGNDTEIESKDDSVKEMNAPTDSSHKTGRENEIELKNRDEHSGEHGPTAPGLQDPGAAPVNNK